MTGTPAALRRTDQKWAEARWHLYMARQAHNWKRHDLGRARALAARHLTRARAELAKGR